MTRRRRLRVEDHNQQLQRRDCIIPLPVRVVGVLCLLAVAWKLVKMGRPLSAIGIVGTIFSMVSLMVSNTVMPAGPRANNAVKISAAALAIGVLFTMSGRWYESGSEQKSLPSTRYF